MNATLNINPKNEVAPLEVWRQWLPLQHMRTLQGLSRRRLSPQDVLDLAADRRLRWAWNIARPGAARAEIRIWRRSLLEYLAAENASSAELPAAPGFDEVVSDILPRPFSSSPRAAVITTSELSRRLGCHVAHINRLAADGELQRVADPCSHAAVILHQSAVEFLRRSCLSL